MSCRRYAWTAHLPAVLQSLACSLKLLMSALCVRVRRSQLNFWLRPDPDADWTSSACPAASKFDLGKLTAPRLLRVLKIAVCVPCRPLAAASLSPPTPSVSFAAFHCSAFTPLTLFVQAHVQAKMAKEGGGGGSNDGSRSDEQAVEIVCSGQVLTSRMNIGTAQRFVWKSGGEMELFFRLTG